MLYIVATPIGNLEDITLRAIRILKEADYILCEDTRVTAKLLARYEIVGKKLISYHQHSNEKKLMEIKKLVENNIVALVTDAGTPGISDPGNMLINELLTPFREGKNETSAKAGMNFKIEPIPGACAVITALSISGFPTDKFVFKGFAPNKKGRETFFREVLAAEETVVFYESCYRIEKALVSLSGCHPDDPRQQSGEEGSRKRSDEIPLRQLADRNDIHLRPKCLVVCRELTKKFETIYRGTAEEILEEIKKEFKTGTPKGEFVIVIN
jgi:16S rRNA (cytidine1402-2'-O)-methyltransferase